MTTFQAIGPSPVPRHNNSTYQNSSQLRPFSDPNRLAPEDAFFAHSPPRRQRDNDAYARVNGRALDAGPMITRGGVDGRRRRDKERGRSASRRGKGVWKKLLWVKQSYPDNYTDPPTFLSHLQRNPRLLPYDFWPLVADSTVIVQHICSVALFVCCFVGIFQERVSPVSVVSWGSAGTVLGWVLWDFWVGQEDDAAKASSTVTTETAPSSSDARNAANNSDAVNINPPPQALGLGLSLTAANLSSRQINSSNTHSISSSTSSPSQVEEAGGRSNPPPPATKPIAYSPTTSPFTPRNTQRLATAKSAILIYSALLALSPILKSLTKSTTSDSIWAMSCWLMCINVFFFDYSSSVVGVKFPASLSTNAALMASTVLASRLPSTTHVFSLTLFSIEVFGLFPVFRRHLRHISWRGHLLLTFLLVIGAGAGMGVTLGNENRSLRAAVGGVFWGGLGVAIGMGACSWWLIGLQKYKNVVIGPWDPARPVIRAG